GYGVSCYGESCVNAPDLVRLIVGEPDGVIIDAADAERGPTGRTVKFSYEAVARVDAPPGTARLRQLTSSTSRPTSTIWGISTRPASMPGRRSRRRCAS